MPTTNPTLFKKKKMGGSTGIPGEGGVTPSLFKKRGGLPPSSERHIHNHPITLKKMWGVIHNAILTTNPSTPGVTKPHPKYQNNNINKQNIKILFKQQQGLPYKMSQFVHHKNILVFPK